VPLESVEVLVVVTLESMSSIVLVPPTDVTDPALA
jgi:hypothetical protein